MRFSANSAIQHYSNRLGQCMLVNSGIVSVKDPGYKPIDYFALIKQDRAEYLEKL